MKRIISLILILILSLGVLSACSLFPTPNPTTPTNPSTEYNVELARDYVRGLYMDLLDDNHTKRDFTLISALMFYGAKYTVDWTVDSDKIAVVPSEDGLETTIDLPDSVEEDLNYKLTGTVLAPDNTSATVEFDLVMLAPEVDPVLDLMGNTNLVSSSGSQNVFAANGVTFTNDKASSSSNLTVQESYAQRAYAGSTIKIECEDMRKIVITCDDYTPDGTKNYYTGMDGMEVEGATIIRKDAVITILFLDGAVDVFQSTNLASQIRIEKIEVFKTLTAEDIAMGENANGGNDGETSGYQAPVEGEAFKFFMEVGSMKYYFKTGELDQGKYLLTTTVVAESTDIFFEVVDGGYHIYFMDGDTKTYINAESYKKSNGYLGAHFAIGTEPNCVWTYNDTFGIFEVYGELEGLDPDTFFAGTYGSYTTMSLSGSYYKAQITSGTQFPARIILSSNAGEEAPHEHNFVDGKCDCGEMDPDYVPPVTEGLQIVTAPEAGVAYKFGLYHGNESANVFFNGENYNSYAWYFAYTPVVDEAKDVYLETVEGVDGGYRLYFMKDDVKTYIVAYPRDGDTTKGTLKFDTTVPSEYYTFSAEHNTLIYTSTTGEQFYLGSSGTYKSISLSAISYISNATSYISHLYAEGNGEGGEVTPPAGDDDTTEESKALTSLKTGDKVYIVAPAYNMALSATKTGYYNVGIDVSEGFASLTDAETWEVTVNNDGTYTFTSLTGSVLALADSYSSLNDTGVNKSWSLEEKSEGIYYVKNTGRGNYLEWYANYNNWSTYGTANSDLFEISFYLAD